MHRENDIKSLLQETERLSKENIDLKLQLAKATNSIQEMKAGSIDALVVASKKELKVYAEQTADKTYRILIEKMNEGAVILNLSGTILYCNAHFATMVNMPLQKVIGTKFKTFIDAASNRMLVELLKKTTESSIKEEVFIHANNGEVVPVLMSVNTLSLNNSAALCIILTDLTTKNRNQEELRRRSKQLAEQNIELENANKELTTFTFITSHDLQEPLRKIQIFISILFKEDEARLSSTGKKYLNRLSEAAGRMRTLIEDLLAYSSTKSGERKFEKIDLNIMLAEVIKDCEEILLEKKATIEAEDLDEVNIIPLQFRQLIYNLIWNSLKFAKLGRPPRIKIEMDTANGSRLMNNKLSSKIDYHHITYSDNGIGFEPQYNERIFEVFQRLQNAEKYRGTGMGLAICKRIVENHKGAITASGVLDRGVTFDIYIPV